MRRLLAIPILISGLGLATACSTAHGPNIPTAGGSASPSASSGSGSMTAFTNCVRQHGVSVPDPNPDFPWNQVENAPGWNAAWSACRALLPPPPSGAAQDLPTAQQLEQLRTFAVCMRAHDIDMSDPTPTGDMIISGRLGHDSRTELNNDPGYKAAYQACKDKLPGGPQWFAGGGKKKKKSR